MRMGGAYRYHPYLGILSMSTLVLHHRLLVLGIGKGFCLSADAQSSGFSSLLITELARDEKVTALQDTQARSYRYRIKVLDLQALDLFSLMFNPALE